MRQASPPPRRSRLVDPAVATLACALTLGALFWAADLYRQAGLQLYTEQFVAGMLALALPLAFIHFRVRADAPRGVVPWYDWFAAGVAAIVQPGGSMRDQESIDAANEHGLAMVFTGVRHFRH